MVFLVPYDGCERIPGCTLHAVHYTCKSSQLIILNVFKYKKSTFLKLWCKLNTHQIVKTYPFCFLCDYFGDSLDVMFPHFPNHFHLCFYDFLGCFYCFPLVFPPFPILNFVVHKDSTNYFTIIKIFLNSFCQTKFH